MWAEPVGLGEGGLILREDAVATLGDSGNWWNYDPDCNWDPEEDLSRYAELDDLSIPPTSVNYMLSTTDVTNELGLTRWPWWDGPARPESPRTGTNTA